MFTLTQLVDPSLPLRNEGEQIGMSTPSQSVDNSALDEWRYTPFSQSLRPPPLLPLSSDFNSRIRLSAVHLPLPQHLLLRPRTLLPDPTSAIP